MNSLTRRLTLLAGHVAIGLLYVFVLLTLWRGDPGIAAENHLMENLQAAGLFLAMLLSLANLAPLRRQPPSYIAAGLAVFFLSLLLREVAPEKLDLPGLVLALSSGTGKNVLLGLLWAGVFFAIVQNRQRLKQDIINYLRSPLFYYLLVGTFFYLAGEIFDKKLLILPKPQMLFWEEAFECLATFWLFLGTAVWTASNCRQRPNDI